MSATPPTVQRRLFDLSVVLLLAIGPAILSSVTAHLWPMDHSRMFTNLRFLRSIFLDLGAIALMIYVVRSQGRTVADIGISFSLNKAS